MIYVILAMGIFLVSIAFVLTEKNAKNLLSGYNMMSTEERKTVDIASLVTYFRKFFVVLGITFTLGSLALIYLGNQTVATVFICCYPVVALVYFVISSQKFNKKIIDK
ncbi:MAG: DUF3784 domain-containing protein [Chitinophagaceae bacterium]|nr:MAG: DUF3784 domain-containing protein [Chitinophagaceae bacterium]